MHTRHALIATLLTFLSGFSGVAQEVTSPKPLLHPLFSDHMVLQRDKEVTVWGWSDPGTLVTVRLGNQPAITAKVTERGKWQVKLGPLTASSNSTQLQVKGSQGEETIQDVLVGDVWICSGQSNMEWPVQASNHAEAEIANANHSHIRLFTVPRRIAGRPQELVDSKWLPCRPEHIAGFSAVGYFFGRELHQQTGIPIGLLHTSWGGTIAEAWTSAAALEKHMPDFRAALRDVHVTEEKETVAQFAARVARWWQEHDQEAEQKWSSPDADHSAWKTMELPCNWETVSPELEQFDGVVWFRRTFSLPADWTPSNGQLNLGPIDDADTTWVNGHRVGGMELWNAPRQYKVSTDKLRPGKNVVAIRVYDGNSGGGIYGEDFPMALELNSGMSIDLTGSWAYWVGPARGDLPAYPQIAGNNPNIVTVLHNAMLAPLQPFGIRGAIWYQGESNAGRAMQYRRLLPTMIKDWRAGFGQGDFPFLIVQLANFMDPQTTPVQSGWAELREAQALTAKQMKNVGIAVTTDIGEANDIHPRNKQDVGKRLALQALSMSYGKQLVNAGPTMKTMRQAGNQLRVQFDHVGQGLVARGGELKGFAIAEADGQFVWADAKIEGNQVVLSHPDVATPTRARYNWGNNPIGNLFNQDGLPAAPFRTDVPATEAPR